ncbi:N-acetyl-gamma-glutamyl-phosphate reductase [Aestuariibacter sp. AA17]|uniref:N-acetyl-gamma-glutamyl-phosphate reductase n=1 Tax=Fluctibacter corallii TaxID=2984329 RepID=A0ABT3A701_9ALTE|nr:N-acetyl-gamma-glutamyl-phosphate reductase [Aestuariibacter sp. AA17]MCV2884390.1 N-acetyl-gamma-glutamyl-phosphate reductase [Aestuariibacter sp. AA17]
MTIKMRCCVIGASGYTGAELVRWLLLHPHFDVTDLFVSHGSQDANKALADIHPSFIAQTALALTPLPDASELPSFLSQLGDTMDAIFLATPHEASHDWMPLLLSGRAKVFDLSGAFRLSNMHTFEQAYGFSHAHQQIQQTAAYGLIDWNQHAIAQSQLVAVPGCYPTASLLALKPLQNQQLLDAAFRPIINATSGVSGAGRKANINTSVCEVSLQAYGILSHRHQPEISEHLHTDVIFTPHLGNFKRGILATVTVKLNNNVTSEAVNQAFKDAYQHNRGVLCMPHSPRLDDVVNTPFCQLHWQIDEEAGYGVITSAIDNLLKGAATQALQCANHSFGFDVGTGLWT